MTDPITTLRDQLLRLQQAHASGALDAASFEVRNAVLERQLLDAVMAPSAQAALPAAAPAAVPLAVPTAAPTAAPGASAGLWAGVGALVLGVAALGYAFTGSPRVIGNVIGITPEAAQRGQAAADAAAGTEAAPTQEQVEAMVAKLAERMQTRPDDAEGWLMLGRSYMMLGRAPDAMTAYERLLKLRPDDAGTLVDYADALAVTNGRTLDGEPTKLLDRALKLEPDNLKALALAGTAAFNRGDFATAVKHWERVAQIGPADGQLVEMVRSGVAEARERGKLPAAGAAAALAAPAASTAAVVAADAATVATAAAPSGPGISGTVRLAAALQSQAAPEDTVFIFARPAEGARMPLAIVRRQVKDLPFDFKLDDSQAVSPAARLSGVKRVIVGARISKSGQAMPQPGDLEGLSAPVDVGAAGVMVEIKAKVP